MLLKIKDHGLGQLILGNRLFPLKNHTVRLHFRVPKKSRVERSLFCKLILSFETLISKEHFLASNGDNFQTEWFEECCCGWTSPCAHRSILILLAALCFERLTYPNCIRSLLPIDFQLGPTSGRRHEGRQRVRSRYWFPQSIPFKDAACYYLKVTWPSVHSYPLQVLVSSSSCSFRPRVVPARLCC